MHFVSPSMFEYCFLESLPGAWFRLPYNISSFIGRDGYIESLSAVIVVHGERVLF